MTHAASVVAAGAVVLRRGPEVLLVHRPKYDDWSFPKGKLDPDEHPTAAAIREVAEETGLDVRLGPPLSAQEYDVRNGLARHKVVHYWTARVVRGDDVSTYRPNAEIDGVAWVPLDKAADVLSYRRDRETLAEAGSHRRNSHPIVVLRHGKAEPRKTWTGNDRKRPLAAEGEQQAERLVPVLRAYGVQLVLSSTSRRCRSTVAPYADTAGLEVEVTADLSEEDASPRRVERQLRPLLDSGAPALLCTHRAVLPYVYASLGVRETKLEAGEMLVVHHHRGQIIAVEHHRP